MKSVKQFSSIVMVIVLVLPVFAWAKESKISPKQKKPKVTALVCSFEPSPESSLTIVIGGYVSGKGWVESEKANNLLQKGDKLALYSLEGGILGELAIESKGDLESERGGVSWGLYYFSSSKDNPRFINPEARETYERSRRLRYSNLPPVLPFYKERWQSAMLVASWCKGAPNPRWLTSEVMDNNDAVSKKIVADWLASKRIPADMISGVKIEQIVRCDINDDKKEELFIAFRSKGAPGQAQRSAKNLKKRPFAYLIMYRPPFTGRKPEIKIIADHSWSLYRVAGFCDLDRDGLAEIVTRYGGLDNIGTALFHWTGKRYVEISGWGQVG